MTAAELGAVALQELDLLLAEHEGGIAGRIVQFSMIFHRANIRSGNNIAMV